MPMMGRGSDTRMYSPRSESDKMYSSANEDEGKYNPASPEYNEEKREEKKRKEEERKERRSKIKHIKIRASQGLGEETKEEGLDDGNKRDDEREMSLQGGPAGSRGTLLDLATGAKSGTGSAMSPGLPIAMSEPMTDAWSELLKRDTKDNCISKKKRSKTTIPTKYRTIQNTAGWYDTGGFYNAKIQSPYAWYQGWKENRFDETSPFC